MNQKIMMFGAIILAVIAIVLAGYSFGEVRSLRNALATAQTQIETLEAAPVEEAVSVEAVEALQADVAHLAEQVGELTERVNEITQALQDVGAPEPDGEVEPEAEPEAQ